MRRPNCIFLAAILAVIFLSAFGPARSEAGITSTYLHSLANFHGKIPYNDVRIRVDRAHDETYVVDRGIVRIFNDAGMEIYWFGDNPELGAIYDLALDEKGDIFLLSFDFTDAANPVYSIVHCNYRGDFRGKIGVSSLPAEYSGFFPNYMFYRNGEFWLLSSARMQVVVADRNGAFRKGFDLAAILEIPEEERKNKEIFGFNLDNEGNMLFTVPVLFSAYVVSPKGELAATFGKRGSAPGMFGLVSGIARDEGGKYFVVERLRSVVMIFDKEFNFLKEFGYRGDKPANLIRPNEVALGNSGKLYVTQLRSRGVSVFSVAGD